LKKQKQRVGRRFDQNPSIEPAFFCPFGTSPEKDRSRKKRGKKQLGVTQDHPTLPHGTAIAGASAGKKGKRQRHSQGKRNEKERRKISSRFRKRKGIAKITLEAKGKTAKRGSN